MTVKKTITEQFVYLSYKRENYNDYTIFKRALENVMGASVKEKDVIIDFVDSTSIASSEIGLLVRLINNFKGTARYLRIAGSEQVTKTLLLTNLDKLGNVTIFRDRKEFLKKLKGTSGD